MAASSHPIDFTKAINFASLRTKTVLITGGADGIGWGLTKAITQAGAYVIIADINAELGMQRVRELEQMGYQALFHHTDVTSFSSQQVAFRHALDWSPSKNIDIVIANAGVAGGSILSSVLSSSSTHNTLPAPNTAAIDVNVNGTYHTAVLALQNFAKYSDSQLIFIGSMASYIVEPTALAAQYTSSKFFVRGLFKSLRFATVFQLGYGLRCNLIVPAWVDTKMIDTSSGALNSQKVKVAAVEDVVAVTMRVMCDETIRGRSVGVVPGGASAQQSGFDMEDDPRGRDGGRVIWQVIGGGSVFGEVVKKVLEFTSWFKA